MFKNKYLIKKKVFPCHNPHSLLSSFLSSSLVYGLGFISSLHRIRIPILVTIATSSRHHHHLMSLLHHQPSFSYPLFFLRSVVEASALALRCCRHSHSLLKSSPSCLPSKPSQVTFFLSPRDVSHLVVHISHLYSMLRLCHCHCFKALFFLYHHHYCIDTPLFRYVLRIS